MRVRLLGTAAGGGVPQWNCNCRVCREARAGTGRVQARTQSSIAICGPDRQAWVIVNASPDIQGQLAAYPDLQPARSPRDTAIAGIVLVDGQVDHTTGLLMLRESTRPLRVWCTEAAGADLTRGNPIFRVLQHYCRIEQYTMPIDGREFTVESVAGVLWQALAVPGKPAPYSPHRDSPVAGDNVALVIRDAITHRTVLYAPGLGAMEPATWSAMQEASCVLVDGTFWTDDEMIVLGLSGKRAREIGHLPQCGSGGMLEWLRRLPATTRRVLIHVNNTNPILDENSPERAELTRHGIEVAWDGLEIEL